jgi:hypothetical protein
MRLINFFIPVLILLLFVAPAISVSSAPQDDWGEIIVPGIEYREYHLPDPNNVFVTRMDRGDLSLALESSIAQGKLSGGTETVSGMASRYDGAINYWDQIWGNSNQVVVAINGFYYDWFSGVPQQGQVHSGWYAKLFDECQSGTVSGSGLSWKLDRSLFIGESSTNPKREILYYRDNSVFYQEFGGINVPRGEDQFILYTPQFDQHTNTDGEDSVEILVQMNSPSLINENVNEIPKGTIVKIYQNKGSTPIPFDHVVLSMHGSKKAEFLALGMSEGDEIGIHQKINKCGTAPAYDWNNTYASIGGAYYFLKDGSIQDFTDDGAIFRHPRTAIAYNDAYVYFIVVDGRDKVDSLGMTIHQLAEFVKDGLGATQGIAQDGGGSSTMVVDGVVKNNTNCNILVCNAKVYIPFVTKSGAGAASGPLFPPARPAGPGQPGSLSGDGLPLTEPFYTFTPDAVSAKLQRLVANGMMMVVVKSKVVSSVFTPGQPIQTLLNAEVHLGPGTNYAVLQTVTAGTSGIISGGDNGLNGVWAKDAHWWRVLLEVDDTDVIGWVSEPYLTIGTE